MNVIAAVNIHFFTHANSVSRMCNFFESDKRKQIKELGNILACFKVVLALMNNNRDN